MSPTLANFIFETVNFLLLAAALGWVLYKPVRHALDAEQDWVWVTPGSFVATILWLVGSLGFRFYAVNFGSFEATYGAIGGVILLLLWFYLTGLAIVIGPEINAEIERESLWAKVSKGKAAGEKRKIGAAAARTHREKTGMLRPHQRLDSHPRESWERREAVNDPPT